MANISITLNQVSKTAVQVENNNFDVVVDRSIEKGGTGKGLMGGQYLLLGIGGCFCSTFFASAQSRDITVEGLKVIVNATLTDDLPKRFSAVSLSASYTSCSHPGEFKKLLNIAEKGCISVNTAKNGLQFDVSEA